MVFATYAAAVAGIFAVSGVAIIALVSAYPDVPEQTLLRSLPALLAGSVAASTALLLTIVLVVRPLEPGALRLRPGWESGRALGMMVIGILALGQSLDSVTTLAGLGDRSAMATIRSVLQQAAGADLFGAVIVIGVLAGTVEEIFFRGYMQTRLRQRWSAPVAIAATSVCFSVLHIDPSGIHVVLAFALSLYLGFVAELTGSVLPAIVCHVVNNIVYTLQTALGGTVSDTRTNVVLAAVGAALFIAVVSWLRTARPPATAA
jgi:membrane protease YdiL (CAAX protease family)